MSKSDIYLYSLFMVVRNSSVLPTGLKLSKTEEEINEMTYETISEIVTMINYEQAEKMFKQGESAFKKKLKGEKK